MECLLRVTSVGCFTYKFNNWVWLVSSSRRGGMLRDLLKENTKTCAIVASVLTILSCTFLGILLCILLSILLCILLSILLCISDGSSC